MLHDTRPPALRYRVVHTVLPASAITNVLIPPDTVAAYVGRLNARNGFYDRLEESIRRDGILNPLLVNAGHCVAVREAWMPTGWRWNRKDYLVCDQCGGSRLYVAQKLGMDVPCIVSDFTGRFDHLPDLTTREGILAYFADRPRLFKFTPDGVAFSSLPHRHLTPQESDNQR